MIRSKNLPIVVIISLIISVILGCAIWDMNFWPTDAKSYYLDSAIKVSQVPFVSQIHDELKKDNIVWVHGKELFMLLASWFQRLLKDTLTLRPFILVCLLSVFFCSILMYLVARHFFKERIALFCFFLFSTCMWPYMYVLFVKHQPTGLMFFLLAVFLQVLFRNGWRRALCFLLSGASMCAAFFASTVSPLYVPYFVAAAFVIFFQQHADLKGRAKIKPLVISIASVLLGGIVTFLFFTYPHVIENTKAYFEYVRISQGTNHFYFNQPVLQQWIATDIPSTRGGWVWVFKYLFLIMPVLCMAYGLAFLYLLKTCIFDRPRPNWKYIRNVVGVFLLSISSLLMAEGKRVAQYGANYFPSLVGVLLLICFAMWVYFKNADHLKKRLGLIVIVVLSFAHVIFNGVAFFSDVYPTRMATTFLSRTIKSLGLKAVTSYSPKMHRQAAVILENLNPEVVASLKVNSVQSLVQVAQGYFIMPPVTEDSVYLAAHGQYAKFDQDLFLNQLLRKSNLEQYAFASFKTLAASKYWPHEAEIPTYRYLMLGLQPQDNVAMGKVWLLDLARLNKDKTRYLPSGDDVRMFNEQIKNIGSSDGLYQYNGMMGVVPMAAKLSTYVARLTKVGNPQDSLIAYAFRLEQHKDGYSVWSPFSGGHRSKPVSAATITSNPQGAVVSFTFDPPLAATAGPYRMMIYRTGKKQANDYYRIYTKFQKFLDL